MTETLIYVNAYAFFVLLIVLGSFKRNSDLNTFQDKTFMVLILLNLLMLLSDSIHEAARGMGSFPYTVFQFFSVLIYILPTAIALCWVYLVGAFLKQKKPKAKWVTAVVHLPFVLTFLIAVSSLFTGSYFLVGEGNTYSRGPLYLMHVIIVYGYLLLSFLNIILHRNTLRQDHYYPLLFFAVPPGIVGVIQILFEGSPYTWAALALSVLMVYLFVLSNQANTDYLTNLFNRREYEQKLQNHVRNATDQKRFGVIFLDLDGFKDINDVYGHKVGDDVLKAMAGILRQTFQDQSETIARIGGDEFAALVSLTDDQYADDLRDHLLEAIEAFNKESGFPFDLRASVSALEYDQEETPELDAFLKRVDDMLYIHKERRRRS